MNEKMVAWINTLTVMILLPTVFTSLTLPTHGWHYHLGAMVQWLSQLHNFVQQNLNLGSAQVPNLLEVCWRFAMVRISDSGPDWKKRLITFRRSTISQKHFIIIHFSYFSTNHDYTQQIICFMWLTEKKYRNNENFGLCNINMYKLWSEC